MDSFASVYPGGSAALALLLLRISLAGQLLLVTFAALELPDWSRPLAWLVALGLSVGIWTRACAAVLSVAALAGFLVLRAPLGPLIGFGGISSLAAALLGPGAYAVDALLFGRRVISLHG